MSRVTRTLAALLAALVLLAACGGREDREEQDFATQEGLTSPFPRGVSLLSWDWDEEEPGVLRITLSEQYGALTDISLTLADYCIVLTLSQLEEVEGVEIRSGGHSAGYRSHQTLRADEVLLWDGLAVRQELGGADAS